MNWNEVEIVKSILTLKNTLTTCPEVSGKMINPPPYVHRYIGSYILYQIKK